MKQNHSLVEKIRLAKKMSLNPTEAEECLYSVLSMYRIVFLKQHIISGYIVDAYLPGNNIAIECDGGYHGDLKQQLYDIDRDQALKKKGVTTLRFTNEQVLSGPSKIVKILKRTHNVKPEKKIHKKYKEGPEERSKRISRYAKFNASKFEEASKLPSSSYLNRLNAK